MDEVIGRRMEWKTKGEKDYDEAVEEGWDERRIQ